ncbi:hypothetical protein BHM03_00062485 [Ensete ventricosum]|uniref:Uncharacterized protein n=1 Tax=Ensete ventricosum TaxID=4639 RepID=A0A445MMV2_ENSVE|nr:hypothetical protein BHM03_00062485 [Ensete ventricosum]
MYDGATIGGRRSKGAGSFLSQGSLLAAIKENDSKRSLLVTLEGAVGLGMASWGVTLVLRTSWFNCSSWIRAKEIAFIRVISLKVDDSNLHPCGVGGSVKPKIALRARDPPDQVSFFPSRDVNLHA